MNKGSIVERLSSDLDRKEPRYKCATLLYFRFLSGLVLLIHIIPCRQLSNAMLLVLFKTSRKLKQQISVDIRPIWPVKTGTII